MSHTQVIYRVGRIIVEVATLCANCHQIPNGHLEYGELVGHFPGDDTMEEK